MSKIDDLEKIQELKSKGILTEEEFENEKNKILGYTKKKDVPDDLKKIEELRSKGTLTEEEFEKYSHLIANDIVRRRAKHAVHENQRVIKAIDALKAGNLELFGELMNASHRSLKEDYEVTGIELDTLAEEGQQLEGVLGSRMTGAGFGGCTVTLVKEDKVDQYIEKVGKLYTSKVNLEATFYIADVGEGARKLY